MLRIQWSIGIGALVSDTINTKIEPVLLQHVDGLPSAHHPQPSRQEMIISTFSVSSTDFLLPHALSPAT